MKKFINYTLLLILILLVIITIHNIIQAYSYFNYDYIYTILLSLTIIALFYLKKIKIKINYEKLPQILLIIYFILLCIIAFNFQVYPNRDIGDVYFNAINKYKNDYFEYYPNNLLLLYIFKMISKVFGTNPNVFLILNICIVQLSVYLTYILSKRITKSQEFATFSLIIIMLFLPYIFYSTQYYTDTFSLPITLAIPLLLFEKDQITKSYKKIIFASLLASVGYLLKGSIIIFLIAIIICLFLNKQKYQKLLVIIPIASFIFINSLFTFTIDQSRYLKRPLKESGFPYTHWIAMGQNQKGQYSGIDVKESIAMIEQNMNKSQFKKIKLDLALARIKQRNLKENTFFYFQKISSTWLESTYDSLRKVSYKPVYKKYIEVINNKKYLNLPYYVFTQIFQYIMYFYIFIGTFKNIKHNKTTPFETYSTLCIIGFFSFFIIWETRSRYLLTITPLLISLALNYYYKTKKNSL